MIRESYNGCADPMRANSIFDARAEAIVDELELKNTSNLGLYSTAADLTKLLELYYYHPDLSESSWNKIADSMLNQPPTKISEDTTYDWRQGLPARFSTKRKSMIKSAGNGTKANGIFMLTPQSSNFRNLIDTTLSLSLVQESRALYHSLSLTSAAT